MNALTGPAPDAATGSAPTMSPEGASQESPVRGLPRRTSARAGAGASQESAVRGLPRRTSGAVDRGGPGGGAGPEAADLVAAAPPEERGLARDEVALVVASPAGVTVGRFTDIAEALRPGDLIVVNASATLAASLPVDGGEGRLHLSTPAPGAPGAPPGRLPDVAAVRRWVVEVRRPHGWGSQPDRDRHPGELLSLPAGAHATLLHPYLSTPHLASRSASGADRLRWDGRSASEADRDSNNERLAVPLAPDRDGAAPPPLKGGGGGWGGSTATRLWVAELSLPGDLLAHLDRHGGPIRYAYTGGAWPLAAYQTVFAREPGSAEMPSAGRPFSARVVRALRRRGVGLAVVTLHTGVSSLEPHEPPFPEPYAVPARTARAIAATRRRGGRVIAVGTTVTRALESAASSAAREGRAAAGWTDLVLGPRHAARVVDGIVSGLHPPGASHLELLEAVVGPGVVAATYAAAREHALLWHEFGDSTLLLRSP